MVRTALLAAVSAALLATPSVQAADILGACAEDIAARCSEVEPGHGRVMACLYAYEDKVSDSCDMAMADTADVIDLMFDRLNRLKTQCGADIRALCQGVEAGQGRILSCLVEQQASLSQSCSGLVGDVELPSE
ncbi:MAG: cysteine rich repeat-containing protein [Pseudomonadota bacterium]